MSVWKIPEGITEITREFVQENIPEGATEVVISQGVESIGVLAFHACESLESVKILEGVESLGNFSFQSCTNLQSVVIPESVTSIGKAVFRLCKSLQTVVIPESVESIGSNVFSCCKALNLIILPDVLVDNCAQYRIADNQKVIKYSDFIVWERDNGLVGKSYSDQIILFLYQLKNIETYKPTWNEILDQFPEVAIHDLLKSADAEPHNLCLKVSIDGKEYPGFADALLENLSLSDGASFFCTAKDKDFRSHQSVGGSDRNSETLMVKGLGE